MTVTKTSLPGVLLLEPRVFEDPRGFFLETFNSERFAKDGLSSSFAQDNWSRSVRHTLRGLHFQQPNPQGKLVWCMRGAVWDVAVDIRRGSPTFGKSYGVELSESNKLQLWVPPGFAHGFCTLSEIADVMYKCTALYAPGCEGAILWNDPELAIEWPTRQPLLSKKDAEAPRLKDAPRLPTYEG